MAHKRCPLYSDITSMVGVLLYVFFSGVFTWKVFVASREFCGIDQLPPDMSMLESVIGFRQDRTDYDLQQFMTFQFWYNIPANLICFFLWKYKINNSPDLKLLCSFMHLLFLFGAVGSFVFILSVVLLYCITKLYNEKFMWIFCTFYIILIGSEDFQFLLAQTCRNYSPLVTSLAWLPMKAVSVFHESRVTSDRDWKKKVLYFVFPYSLVYGPFHPYVSKMEINTNTKAVILQLIKWSFIITFLWSGLHFLHFNSLITRNFYDANVPGSLRMMCVFFSATYFSSKVKAMYEMSMCFVDTAVKEGYTTPKCVGFLYDYRHVWKLLDSTMHWFLKRYIIAAWRRRYPHGTFLYRQAVTCSCFVFITIFHGYTWHSNLWCLMNYMCLVGLSVFVQENPNRNSLIHGILMLPFTTTSMVTSVA